MFVEMVIVPTIVTVEEPSQASEGKSDSSPTNTESFSPLPEGTSLAPLRDFPLIRFIWRKWKATLCVYL